MFILNFKGKDKEEVVKELQKYNEKATIGVIGVNGNYKEARVGDFNLFYALCEDWNMIEHEEYEWGFISPHVIQLAKDTDLNL